MQGIDINTALQVVSVFLNFGFVLAIMWIRAELKVLNVKIDALEKSISVLEKREEMLLKEFRKAINDKDTR